MKILLDTNAYSAIASGHRGASDLLRYSQTVFFSAVVLGEVLAGFRHGSHREENLQRLRRFLAHPRIRLVPVTETTADRYSRIHGSLRSRGKPIPTNDLWIAAHALETGADLVSFDVHFGEVEGLVWVRPEA